MLKGQCRQFALRLNARPGHAKRAPFSAMPNAMPAGSCAALLARNESTCAWVLGTCPHFFQLLFSDTCATTTSQPVPESNQMPETHQRAMPAIPER